MANIVQKIMNGEREYIIPQSWKSPQTLDTGGITVSLEAWENLKKGDVVVQFGNSNRVDWEIKSYSWQTASTRSDDIGNSRTNINYTFELLRDVFVVNFVHWVGKVWEKTPAALTFKIMDSNDNVVFETNNVTNKLKISKQFTKGIYKVVYETTGATSTTDYYNITTCNTSTGAIGEVFADNTSLNVQPYYIIEYGTQTQQNKVYKMNGKRTENYSALWVCTENVNKGNLAVILIEGKFDWYNMTDTSNIKVMKEDWLKGEYQIQQSTEVNVWYNTSEWLEIEQPIKVNFETEISWFDFMFKCVGDPTDDFIISFREDNNELVAEDTTWTLHGSEFRTDWLFYTFSCNPVTLKAGKVYKLNFRRTWTTSTANYYKISSYSNNAVANNIVTYYNKINASGYSTIQNHNLYFKMHDNYLKYYPSFLDGTARDQAFWYKTDDRDALCQTYQYPVSFNAKQISFSLKKTGNWDWDVKVSICPMKKTKKGTINMSNTTQSYNTWWDLGRVDTTKKIAQQILVDSDVSTDVILMPFTTTSALDGDIILWVYKDNNGEIGTKIADASIDASMLSLQTGNQRRKFIFSDKIDFVSWDLYWFVVEKDAISSDQYINIKWTNSKTRRTFKIFDNTNNTRTEYNNTLCYIIWDTFENAYYAPDLENAYASKVIRNTSIGSSYTLLNVDFGKDVIIPAFEEFAVVWEKTIDNNIEPYFNIISRDWKWNNKQGNKLVYAHGSWKWNADRDRYIYCWFSDMHTYLADQDIWYQFRPSLTDMQQVINVASKITDDISYVKIRAWVQEWAIMWGNNSYIPDIENIKVYSAWWEFVSSGSKWLATITKFIVNDDWFIDIIWTATDTYNDFYRINKQIYKNWTLMNEEAFWWTTSIQISKWDIIQINAHTYASHSDDYCYVGLKIWYQIYTPSSEERSGTVIS